MELGKEKEVNVQQARLSNYSGKRRKPMYKDRRIYDRNNYHKNKDRIHTNKKKRHAAKQAAKPKVSQFPFGSKRKTTEATMHAIFSGRKDRTHLNKMFRSSYNRIFTSSSYKPVSSHTKPKPTEEELWAARAGLMVKTKVKD